MGGLWRQGCDRRGGSERLPRYRIVARKREVFDRAHITSGVVRSPAEVVKDQQLLTEATSTKGAGCSVTKPILSGPLVAIALANQPSRQIVELKQARYGIISVAVTQQKQRRI
jgi:hypothetical protein